MLIAAKYEEIYVPKIEDFVDITDNTYLLWYVTTTPPGDKSIDKVICVVMNSNPWSIEEDLRTLMDIHNIKLDQMLCI